MPSKAPARNDVDGCAEEVREFALQPRERERPESFWPIDEKVNVGLRRVRPASDAAKYPDVAGPVCRREVTHLPSVPDKPSPQICRSAKPEKTRHFWLASGRALRLTAVALTAAPADRTYRPYPHMNVSRSRLHRFVGCECRVEPR